MTTDMKHESERTASDHTPGPWFADFHGHILAHGGTTNVASTWTTPDENYPEGRPYKANARLIAASPKLLAFAATIARLTQDGEEVDGEEFVMENDDAVDTLNALIDEARGLVDEAKGLVA